MICVGYGLFVASIKNWKPLAEKNKKTMKTVILNIEQNTFEQIVKIYNGLLTILNKIFSWIISNSEEDIINKT